MGTAGSAKESVVNKADRRAAPERSVAKREIVRARSDSAGLQSMEDFEHGVEFGRCVSKAAKYVYGGSLPAPATHRAARSRSLACLAVPDGVTPSDTRRV